MAPARVAAIVRDQDVAVGHVRQLVGQHALELVVVEDPHDALGDGHHRVLAGCGPVAKAFGCSLGIR